MKFRKLMIGAVLLIAVTGVFSFRPLVRFSTAKIGTFCYELLPTQEDCQTYNTGSRCTSYFNATYPALPAYEQPSQIQDRCVYPLYHEFY